MMKTLFAVVLIVGVCGVLAKFDESLLSEDFKSLKDALHNSCVEETGVKEEFVKRAADGQLEENANLKCYAKCVFKGLTVLSDEGKFDFNPIKKWVPEGKSDDPIKTMESCRPKTEGVHDLCEKAFALVKCAAETDPDNFYFF